MYSVQSGSLKKPFQVESTSSFNVNINHIPPEIITQVLLFYLRTSWETRKYLGYSRQFLRDIRLTCKRWRDIIVSTPEFWVFVDIQIAPNGTPSLSLSELDKWLERSRQLPLTISFEVQATTRTTTHTTLTAQNTASPASTLLQRLMDHLPRWQDVSLTFSLSKPPSYELPAFLITGGGSMIAPILESLSVKIHRPGYYRVLQWITPLLASSPRLRVFADKGITGLPLHVVPLSQLREITLENYWSSFQGLHILAKMPMLERCRLSFFDGYKPQDIVIAPIICYAKYMTLSFDQGGPTFFTHLIAPNLTELSYHAISPPFSPSFHQSLLSFLMKTHGQITSFTIRSNFMESNELMELLRVLSPSLEKLAILAERFTSPANCLRVKSFSKDVVTALTYHGEQRLQIPLDGEKSEEDFLDCPKLQVLILERCEDAVDDGLISDMVASRRAHLTMNGSSSTSAISELYFFSIVFLYQSSHPLDVERLARMRQKGLIGATEFVYPHDD